MTDYEIRVKTDIGEFTVHFTDNEDLKKKLSQIAEFKKTVEESIGSILVKERPKVLSGFEDIYATESDGTVKLLKYPKQKADVIRLALFLSSSPLSTRTIEKITGIDNPLAIMRAKDFIETSEGYTISSDARAKVMGEIIPQMRKASE
jgi:hypothetical protein